MLYYRFAELAGVDDLASQRGYKNRDEITVSPDKMGDVYEDKVKSFFHEHLHEDEEIRYIRDGRGFFDVRSKGDEWVRIALEKVSSFSFCHFGSLKRRRGGSLAGCGVESDGLILNCACSPRTI